MKKQTKISTLILIISLISYCSPSLVKVKGLHSGRIQGDLKKSDYEYSLQLLKKSKKYLLQSDTKNALKYVEQSLKINTSLDALYLKGLIYSTLQSDESKLKAISIWKEALKFSKNNSVSSSVKEEIYLQIALAYTALGDIDNTLKSYENLSSRFPKEKIYKYKLALLYKQKAEFVKAKKILKALLPVFKKKELIYLHLGEIASREKKYSEAEMYFAKAKKRNPKLTHLKESEIKANIKNLIAEGQNYLKQKNPNAALKYFLQVIAKRKNYYPAYFLAAHSYLALKKYKAAENYIKKGLLLKKDSLTGAIYLLSLYIESSQLSKAKKLYPKILAGHPNNVQILNLAGKIEQKTGNPEKGLFYFYKAIEKDSSFIAAYMNAAFCLMDLKKYAKAETLFSKARKLEPQNSANKKALELARKMSLNKQALSLMKEAKYNKALEKINQAIKLFPDETLLYLTKGRIYQNKGNFSEAEKSYYNCLEKDSNYAPAYFYLHLLYQSNPYKYKKNIKKLKAKMLTLAESSSDFSYQLGVSAQAEGKEKQAENHYRNCLNNNAENKKCAINLAELLHKKANSLAKKGYLNKSEELLKEAMNYYSTKKILNDLQVIEQNLKHKNLYGKIQKADKLYKKGYYKKALMLYNQLYKKLDRAGFLLSIINCHFNLNEEEKAIKLLKQGEKKYKHLKNFNEALYSYYLKKGRYKKARQGFEAIIKKYPKDAFAFYKIAIIYLKQKNYKKAKDFFQQAALLSDTLGEAYIGMGLSLYKLKQNKKARAAFLKAKLFPASEILAVENLGLSYLLENDTKSAKALFANLIKKYPNKSTGYYYLSYMAYSKGKLQEAKKYIQKALYREKNAENYYAYFKILRKLITSGKNKYSNTLAIKKCYYSMLKIPGAAHYIPELRLILQNLGQKSLSLKVQNDYESWKKFPLAKGDFLLLSYQNKIKILNKTTLETKWTKEFSSNIKAVNDKDYIFVLLRKSLLLYHWEDGTLFKKIRLYHPAERKLLLNKHYAYYISRDSKNNELLVVKNLLSWKERALLRISKTKKIKFFQNGNKLYVLSLSEDNKNTNFYFLNADKVEKLKVDFSFFSKDKDLKKLLLKKSGILSLSKKELHFFPPPFTKIYDYKINKKSIKNIYSSASKLYLQTYKYIIIVDKNGDFTKQKKPSALNYIKAFFPQTNSKENKGIFLNYKDEIYVFSADKWQKIKLTGKALNQDLTNQLLIVIYH